MNNYSLDTPVRRKIYIPDDSDVPFAPVEHPPHTTEVDQTFRKFQWLFHKPQQHAIFPKEAESARLQKKK